MKLGEIKHFIIRLKSFISKPRVIVQSKYVVLNDSDYCQNPIMVFGIHRSGTSLFRRILNSHSSISCPPESYFFERFVRMAGDDDIEAGLAGFGYGDRESFLNEIRKWMTIYHEANLKADGKSRWADKTPQYVHCADEIMALLPSGAQSILVYRHPFDIIYSIYDRGWRFGEYDSDLFKNTVLYVRDSYLKLLDFEDKYNCYSFRYEDLTADPKGILRGVFEFLGEEWEEQVLNYNEKKHNLGTEDPVVAGAKGFFSNNEKWKMLDQDKIEFMLLSFDGLLSRKGYEK